MLNSVSKRLSHLRGHLTSNKTSPNHNALQNVAITHKQYVVGDKAFTHLKLNSTINVPRPSNFVLAIDSSQSMGGPCTYAGNPDPECSKYSRMDLVKHSARVVANCLRPIDTLSIVSFSTTGAKLLGLTNMTDQGRDEALKIIDWLQPDNMTNLYDGLTISLNELDTVRSAPGKNNFALMLTDGVPNVNPPRGNFQEFLNRIGHSPLQYGFHNFGYGYELEGSLLSDLSSYGGGLFAHIPDHTMCNTVFINFLANCLATTTNKVKLQMQSKQGCDNINVINSIVIGNEYVDIGGIQSGQQRNILVSSHITNPSNHEFTLNLDIDGKIVQYTIKGEHSNSKSCSIKAYNPNSEPFLPPMLGEVINEDVCYHLLKSMLVEIIKGGINTKNLVTTTQQLNGFSDMLVVVINETSNQKVKKGLTKLLKNVRSTNDSDGQISKAFEKDEWFNRWGMHYLRYYLSSVSLEVCSNFKDASLQNYGGKLFTDLRTEIEDIFTQMPVPQPSRSTQSFQGNFQQSFYSSAGPCFAGDGKITMAPSQLCSLSGESVKSTVKLVQDIRKGDRIINADGNVATVVCVLKTKIKGGRAIMSNFNGLKVSPWHPVKLPGNNLWQFPTNVQPSAEVDCDWFYDFVLDKHHVVTINGVDVICLGHGLTHDPTLIHPFFGTQKVVDELKKDKEGWDKGEVVILDYKPFYNKNSKGHGLVDGFKLDTSNFNPAGYGV